VSVKGLGDICHQKHGEACVKIMEVAHKITSGDGIYEGGGRHRGVGGV